MSIPALMGGAQEARQWAACIHGELEQIRDFMEDDAANRERSISRPFVIQTDGAGRGVAEAMLLPPGITWKLLTVAFAGSATGTVQFYVDTEDPTRLIRVIPSALLTDGSFVPDGHYIPEQSKLLIVTTGQAANTVVAGRVTMKGGPIGTGRNTDVGGF